MITTFEQQGNTTVVYRVKDEEHRDQVTRIGAIFQDGVAYRAVFALAGGLQMPCATEEEALREICKRAQASRLGA